MPKRLTTEEFIKRAKQVHSNKYDYSKVEYKGSYKDVCIICPEHGEFWQKPYIHLNGHGCIDCAKKRKHTKETFINVAKEIHGDKYDYSKVEYINNKTKVCIICPEHGDFWQRPDKHLWQKRGCPKCGGTKKLTTEEFIEKAKEIHGDKYDYSKVEYISTEIKVCIICPEHGEFWQTPHAHLLGQGCYKCNESIMEKEMEAFLKENKITFVRQKTFDWLIDKGKMFLDFFLPDYNIAIECQGIQHFEPVEYFGGLKQLIEQQKKDFLKNKLCYKHGINIFYYTNLKSNFFEKIYTNKNELLKKIYG